MKPMFIHEDSILVKQTSSFGVYNDQPSHQKQHYSSVKHASNKMSNQSVDD
jgi:hypothetical protein